ncbi:MAG: hypothetical protein ACK55K_04995 [Bacteroidota bacterium]|jgi:hypothetical protein
MVFNLIDESLYQKRLKKIEPLSSKIIKSIEETYLLNDLVIKYSKDLLKNHGKIFDVKLGKTDRRKYKLGNCFANSIQVMSRNGFNYVEGYFEDSLTGNRIAHAWNCDDEGNHFDFTLTSITNKSFVGIIIPPIYLYDIGEKNGKIWYANLPFLKIE